MNNMTEDGTQDVEGGLDEIISDLGYTRSGGVGTLVRHSDQTAGSGGHARRCLAAAGGS